jgi:Protein of unknown function (DUF2934)
MSSKRVLIASDRKEPEEQTGSTRPGKGMSGKQPRAKTSSRGKNRELLRAGEEQESKTPSANEDIQPRVAERAYQLYQRRGGHHGQDLDDWFLAEQEVMAEDSWEDIEP